MATAPHKSAPGGFWPPVVSALGCGWALGVGQASAQSVAPAPPSLAASTAVATAAANPAALPAQAFFSRPAIESVRLSPSGRWLAVFDLLTMKPVAMAASFADADIDEVAWLNDDMLVFSTQDNQRGGADQRYWPGPFSARRDGEGALRQLVGVTDSFLSRAVPPTARRCP